MSRQATRQVVDTTFSRNLKASLALSETTAEAFARAIDKPLRTVQRWRAGETEPRGEELVVIARELGVTVEDLFRDGGELEPAA